MLKYAAYHPEKFQSRFNAILISVLKGTVVILTEYIMIFNLVLFTDDNGVKQVAFDFAALAVIATFDDSMLSIFHMTKILNFNQATLPFMRFVEPRRKYLVSAEEKYF